MDTGTVLKIIEIIDARLRYYDEFHSLDNDEFGAIWALKDFRDHLQSFIEGQLNAAELQSGE